MDATRTYRTPRAGPGSRGGTASKDRRTEVTQTSRWLREERGDEPWTPLTIDTDRRSSASERESQKRMLMQAKLDKNLAEFEEARSSAAARARDPIWSSFFHSKASQSAQRVNTEPLIDVVARSAPPVRRTRREGPGIGEKEGATELLGGRSSKTNKTKLGTQTSNPTEQVKGVLLDKVVSIFADKLSSTFQLPKNISRAANTTSRGEEGSSTSVPTSSQPLDSYSSAQLPAEQGGTYLSGGRSKRGLDHVDGDEGPSPRLQKSLKVKEAEVLHFACPYFKYNPSKYQTWRGCPGPGWPEVHRIKEHLHRKHRRPKYRCSRCGDVFTDERKYIDHQRRPVACVVKTLLPLEGVSAEQEASLKRRVTGLSDVEKWKAMFRILFPLVAEDDIPSPFYEYDDENSSKSPSTKCKVRLVEDFTTRFRAAITPELAGSSANHGQGVSVDRLVGIATETLKGVLGLSMERAGSPSVVDNQQETSIATERSSDVCVQGSGPQGNGETVEQPWVEVAAGSVGAEFGNLFADISSSNFTVDPHMLGSDFDPGLVWACGTTFSEADIQRVLREVLQETGETETRRISDSGYESNPNSFGEMGGSGKDLTK